MHTNTRARTCAHLRTHARIHIHVTYVRARTRGSFHLFPDKTALRRGEKKEKGKVYPRFIRKRIPRACGNVSVYRYTRYIPPYPANAPYLAALHYTSINSPDNRAFCEASPRCGRRGRATSPSGGETLAGVISTRRDKTDQNETRSINSPHNRASREAFQVDRCA